jgi:hypothetical protein
MRHREVDARAARDGQRNEAAGQCIEWTYEAQCRSPARIGRALDAIVACRTMALRRTLGRVCDRFKRFAARQGPLRVASPPRTIERSNGVVPLAFIIDNRRVLPCTKED